jgi:hypothetical protein
VVPFCKNEPSGIVKMSYCKLGVIAMMLVVLKRPVAVEALMYTSYLIGAVASVAADHPARI